MGLDDQDPPASLGEARRDRQKDPALHESAERSLASPGGEAATSRTRTEPSNDSHTSCSRALSTATGRLEMRKYNPPSRSR